jgi:hypothetical protein
MTSLSGRSMMIFAIVLAAPARSDAWAQAPMPMHDHAMAVDRAAALRIYRDRDDLVVDVGPIDLPAHAEHDVVRQPPPLAAAVPVDGWLRGYVVEMVDGAGERVPQRVLHHLNVIAPEKRELFSPIMLRIAAAGAETAPVALPGVVAYHVHAGDSLLVSMMLHNPTDRAYSSVHVRVRMPYSEQRWWRHPLAVVPFYLDVMPPAGSHSFDVPPGRSEFYWEGHPATGGRIVAMGGHMHKYGVELRLEDRTDNRVVWRDKSITDSTGDIVAMPISMFVRQLGLPMRPDHVYRLVAVYENPTGHTIVDGGMGALGGVVWPMGSKPWPSVDRSSRDYQFDVRYTWRQIASERDDMHHPE